MRKFDYLHVIQGSYGGGWEDVSEYDNRREALADLKEYRIASPEYPHRVIQRRELRRTDDE